MTETSYIVIPPGQTEQTQMLIPSPWSGPTTSLAPNVRVISAPLFIDTATGELGRGWCGWRIDGDTLSRAGQELLA